MPSKKKIDPADEDFGTICNCAVRYACGRQTYMPSLIIDFLTPLLPQLSSRTLWCLDQDLTEKRYDPYPNPYGDPTIDEPEWLNFLSLVRAERLKRGEELYKSYRAKEVEGGV